MRGALLYVCVAALAACTPAVTPFTTIIHGDDDQIVPFEDSAPLSAKS